jgi:hypothetical protein
MENDKEYQDEYNGPLHANSSMLKKLDELIPKFTELDLWFREVILAIKKCATKKPI